MNAKIKTLWQKYQDSVTEARDLQEEFVRDREEMLESIRD